MFSQTKTNVPMPNRQCFVCHEKTLKQCPCGIIAYCSSDCQKKDWKRHKPEHKRAMTADKKSRKRLRTLRSNVPASTNVELDTVDGNTALEEKMVALRNMANTDVKFVVNSSSGDVVVISLIVQPDLPDEYHVGATNHETALQDFASWRNIVKCIHKLKNTTGQLALLEVTIAAGSGSSLVERNLIWCCPITDGTIGEPKSVAVYKIMAEPSPSLSCPSVHAAHKSTARNKHQSTHVSQNR